MWSHTLRNRYTENGEAEKYLCDHVTEFHAAGYEDLMTWSSKHESTAKQLISLTKIDIGLVAACIQIKEHAICSGKSLSLSLTLS